MTKPDSGAHMKRLERLRDQAAERGDSWEATEMQKQIDYLDEVVWCTCGAIISLELLPHPDGWCESWTALRSVTHFAKSGSTLLEPHWPDYVRSGKQA